MPLNKILKEIILRGGKESRVPLQGEEKENQKHKP